MASRFGRTLISYSTAAQVRNALGLNYVAGNFTPTYITDGTQFTSVGYDQYTYGEYSKIGKQVTIQLRIVTNALTAGSASGNLYVTGLPYPGKTLMGSSDSTQSYQTLTVAFRAGWAATPPISALVAAGGTPHIALYHLTSITAASAQVDYAALANGAYLYIGGTYFTD